MSEPKQADAGTRARDDRPHVVMLVDNVIVGDSRVQKEARSMQDRGWRVTLVGRRMQAQGKPRATFDGVPARMVYLDQAVNSRPELDRSTRVRSPLAYPNLREARRQVALSTLGMRDAVVRINLDKAEGTDTGLRKVRSRANMARAKARSKVARRRSEATDQLRETRLKKSGLTDRMAATWWRAVSGSTAWRRLDPSLVDWELAYAPVVDRLAPDLIHANDHRMLHVAAKAVERARAKGRNPRLVWDAHEWLPGLETAAAPANWLPAQVQLEAHHVRDADSVVTVSSRLAEMLAEEHGLDTLPDVVCNAPIMEGAHAPAVGLREAIGVGEDVRLLLYSGGVSAERGVDIIVRALPELPADVHFAMVVKIPLQPAAEQLLTLAEELGVRDRVHTAPYVPVDQIVPYLSDADIGVHTLLHAPNNEIALPTKFYEYAQSRLPMVVSDVKVMGGTAEQVGLGEVFTGGDVASFVAAARKVLADPARYRAAYDDADLMTSWTWETQAEVLDQVYRRTLGHGPNPQN